MLAESLNIFMLIFFVQQVIEAFELGSLDSVNVINTAPIIAGNIRRYV